MADDVLAALRPEGGWWNNHPVTAAPEPPVSAPKPAAGAAAGDDLTQDGRRRLAQLQREAARA